MALAKGDPLRDFREQNPVLATKLEFANIYDEYSKEEASKICWAVFMLEEPDQDSNPYARTPMKERLEEIQRNYYNLDINKFKKLIDAYSLFSLDFEENMYKIQKDKLDDLTRYFKDLKLDNDDQFDKYMKISDKLAKIWNNFEIIKNKLEKSKSQKTHTLGNVALSKSEERRNKTS